jgi:hypothetical protein
MGISLTDRPDVGETNGLVDGIAYHDARHKQEVIEKVDWATKGLYVTRLRLLSDPGFPVWDVSYCHGVLDGKHVDVELPFDQLPKRNYRGFIVQEAKRERVYAKALGILDNISTLN